MKYHWQITCKYNAKVVGFTCLALFFLYCSYQQVLQKPHLQTRLLQLGPLASTALIRTIFKRAIKLSSYYTELGSYGICLTFQVGIRSAFPIIPNHKH